MHRTASQPASKPGRPQCRRSYSNLLICGQPIVLQAGGRPFLQVGRRGLASNPKWQAGPAADTGRAPGRETKMRHRIRSIRPLLAWLVLLVAVMFSMAAAADETCNSPYMAGLIKGQEDYVHVWTLGVEGWGDGSDKLVTIDANPKSKTYGRVIHSLSVGARGEAHHMGFTDDRKYLWAGGLDDNRIYVFDVGTEPPKPRLVKTITDLAAKTRFAGPHTFYALPGRM